MKRFNNGIYIFRVISEVNCIMDNIRKAKNRAQLIESIEKYNNIMCVSGGDRFLHVFCIATRQNSTRHSSWNVYREYYTIETPAKRFGISRRYIECFSDVIFDCQINIINENGY